MLICPNATRAIAASDPMIAEQTERSEEVMGDGD
jgi:hypothetical protein